MPTANERLADATVSHQVNVEHYSNDVVRRMVSLLNRVDSDLVARLSVALEAIDSVDGMTAVRLDDLLQHVRALNAKAYNALAEALPHELLRLSSYEIEYQTGLFGKLLPVAVDWVGVNAETTYAAAMARPFQGRLLNEWVSSLQADRAARLRDTVRLGFVEGRTIDEIVRSVRGTKAQNYVDGVLDIDRRNAEAVVRTAVSHTANFARDRVLEANGDIIKAVQWVSTLDTRTTPLCQVRDGLKYSADEEHTPIGHRVPWLSGPGRLHWRCRSTSAPVLKSFRELGIPLDEFSAEERASMDGQVAADMSYGDWLKKQNAARQDEVLGPTRGALLRSGSVGFDKFFNDKGVFLDLDQLKVRDGA